MLNSLTKTFVKYKIAVLIGGFLVVIIVGVFIFTRVFATSKVDIQVSVKPTLTLGPCFNNQTAPKTTIVTPATNTKYTTGDKVALSGLAVLECDNSKIADKDLSWYLDSDSAPFASGLTYSLEGLKAGDHKIRLVSLSGKLKGEASINVKFEDPKPQVLGIKTPPPAPPAAPPKDNAPVVKVVSIGKATYVPGDPFVVTGSYDNGIYTTTLDLTALVEDEEAISPIWTIGREQVGQGSTIRYTFSMTAEEQLGCQTTRDFAINVSAIDSKQQSGEANFVIQLRGECAANRDNLLNLNLDLSL